MILKKSINYFYMVFFLLLAGCGHMQTLRPLKKSCADFVEEKEGIELRVKRLASMLGLGIVQLSVVNKCDNTICLSREDVSCSTYSLFQLAPLVKKMPSFSHEGAVIAGVLGSLGLSLLAEFRTESIMACYVLMRFLVPISVIVVGYAGFSALRSYDAAVSLAAYNYLKKHLLYTLSIEPGASGNCLLAMEKVVTRRPFTCTVHVEDRLVQFDVNLRG